MSQRWFIRLGGKIQGPFDGDGLARLARAGKITLATEVRQDEEGTWLPAARLKGLFPEPPNPVPPIASDSHSAYDHQPPPLPPSSASRAPADSSAGVRREVVSQGDGGTLRPINASIPAPQRQQLLPNENAYHFAFIDAKDGGCPGTGKAAKHWVMVTNQRILYDAAVKQSGSKVSYQHIRGSIPVAKISFVGIVTVEKSEGCNTRRLCLLRINSGGGEIELAIPTETESQRLQTTIDHLISAR